jgi:two-component system, NtrC family, response regulator HydG
MIPIINDLPPILLLDDDPVILELSTTALQSEGINNIVTLDDSRNLLKHMENNPVSMVILDLMMPHISGVDLIPILNRNFPNVPLIVMTSTDDIETAVNCIKSGAFDYLTKPMETGRLLTSVEKALRLSALSRENSTLRDYLLSDRLDNPSAFDEIITTSKKMRSIFQYIEVISKSDQPVLISGETGVGKELIARSISELSGRPGTFVTVNVAGLDDNMFSDALFGHVKGAFTGADKAREGLIGSAANGTLFLDEIGDLNESSQIKLLRLIQEHEFYPMGSDTLKKSDARIIVATNRDLTQLISSGKFRKDLYYRLCAHRIHVPPLRERREDIPLLMDHFLVTAAKSLNKAKPAPSPEVVALLSTCQFEGNVRELHAIIFDAVARNTSDVLTLDSFEGLSKDDFTTSQSLASFNNEPNEMIYSLFGRFPTIKEVEDYLIEAAMKMTNGNQRSAALLLGIARQTLSKRLSILSNQKAAKPD